MRSQDETGQTAAGLRVHGGRIDLAARLYPSAPTPWIDLSTGINPVAWPVPAIALARYQRLPLARDLAKLAQAAGQAYGRPANAAIVPVPGSELAIRLLPYLLGAGRAGILAPSYGSYAAAWGAVGRELQELADLPDTAAHDLATLIVVNPNNPDGRTFARTELASFARAWTATGRRLIVDEAFADVRPEVSMLALPQLPISTVVLRSFGKFFGLAGLRLGFVVVAEADAATWRAAVGDWPVSGPACEIATSALRDTAWIAATRARLAADRTRLDRILSDAGLKFIGGTDLFGLFEAADGVDLLDHFARAGILIRSFTAMPQRYRLGLPESHEAWQRLEAACRTLT